MKKLITFEQAIGLAKVGYCQDSIHQYKYNDVGRVIELGSSERMYNTGNEWNAPAVSEALDWFREEKRVRCAVSMHTHSGNCDFVYYISYYSCSIQNTIVKDRFKTYSEAESALLDALIEYLS